MPEPMKKRARKLEARSYQTDVFEKARRENVIVFLGTGTGKTHIAVMLINSVEANLTLPDQKRIVVFLAPTVHLVIQQARVISEFTELNVGSYYGDKGVDTWSLGDWQKEFNSHHIFVMTPQVFLDALSTSALRMETVELLILDECHHAQKKHPYALIMQTHYHVDSLKSKPKIFGMTASPVIQKGVSSSAQCSLAIQALENVLDAKVYTLEGRSDVEQFAPSPTQYVVQYETSTHSFKSLRMRLDQARDGCPSSSLTEKLRNKILNSVTNIHSSIEYCLSELGLCAAVLAVQTHMTQKQSRIKMWKQAAAVPLEDRQLKSAYKERYLRLVSSILADEVPDATTKDMVLAVQKGFISSKVLALLNLLKEYRDVAEYMRCIVFVERVIGSVVLAKLIAHFLTSVPCDYVTGTNNWCSRTPTQQQDVLDKFAIGELNLLVATSVAEEGLDVQKCSAVVRFDVCLTMRSNVQSRGRARRPASNYTWLLERGNMEQEELLLKLMESEKVMKEEVQVRNDLDFLREPPPQGDMEVFRVESGACRSTEDSVGFIYRYCARLPGDRFYNPRPTFHFTEFGNDFTCTVKFPPNAPLHSVDGPARRTRELAKKVACLKAIEKLLDDKAVRPDTLCPDIMDVDEEDEVMPKNPAGKPLELCLSAKPVQYNAKWLRNPEEVNLNMYRISFSESSAYANFALLLEGVLDEELLSMDVLLRAKEKEMKANVCHVGQLQLNVDQVNASKAFHELLFNAAFRRLHLTESSGHWDESESYLLLPINDEDGSVDWESVFSAAEAFKTLSHGLPSVSCDMTSFSGSEFLYTAGGKLPFSMLLDSIVVAVHSKKLYCVTGVLDDLSANSLLSGKQCTYVDYYRDKYGKQLYIPMQPLLQVKQSHGFHNLLRRVEKDEHVTATAEEKPRPVNYVELPPELCLSTGLSSGVMRSLYFVPSFMHRLTAMIRACQLRAVSFPRCPWVPASKILEALTRKKCEESFSLESLELLGDSFLKYCVTRRLFLVYTSKHEGQLTARRSRATCNATLNQLAKSLGISEYVRNSAFDPSCWVFPGMYETERLTCEHDMNKLTSSNEQDLQLAECIHGHRYISWKVLADVVEAIIGAYFVSGGEECAVEVMNSMGIEVKFDASLIDSVRQRSFSCEFPPFLESLEQKLHYTFQNKSLLVEAVTHASEPETSVCYQRLEFLGDGALDFLVSKHFFENHPGLPPGKLTDLRSAAVNNDCFARVVAKHELYLYLRYESDELDQQIREFAQASQNVPIFGFDGPSGPKVLGDLLESLAGAVLVDTGFDLVRLWEVMLPLLSPMVTPHTLPLHPVRELRELCAKETCEFSWDDVEKTATAKVKIGNQQFIERAQDVNKTRAKMAVARKMLLTLQKHGLRQQFTHLTQHLHAETDAHQDTNYLALTESDMEIRTDSTVSSHHREPVFTKASSSSATFVTEQRDNAPPLSNSVQDKSEITLFMRERSGSKSGQTPVDEILNTATTPQRDGNPLTNAWQSTAVPTSLTLPTNFSSRIDCPGAPRSLLYELCDQRRLQRPTFQVDEIGVPHLKMFKASLAFNLSNTLVEETGEWMNDKKKAMDDVCRKVLLRLSNTGARV